MEGWIKLHRKFTTWEWYQDSNMVHLFLHLLLSANHENNKWKGNLVKRGQLITGLKSLSKETGLSIQSIRTCLKKLKKTNEINMQSNNLFSIITICNYDSYQSINNETNNLTNKRSTNDQQTINKRSTTNKNVKNVKNEKEINIPDFDDFKNYVLTKEKNIDLIALKYKYDSWIENNWKDGNDKKIKNWKSKILNTLQFLPKTENKENNNYIDTSLLK